MTLWITEVAAAEIAEAISYIAAHNSKAANALQEEIEATFSRICEHPKSAPIVYKGEVRAAIAGRFDYRIFYAIDQNRIIIRNVRSMKRQRPWER